MNDAHLGQETKKVSKNKSKSIENTWCALDLWIKDDFSNENRQTGYVLYIYGMKSYPVIWGTFHKLL